MLKIGGYFVICFVVWCSGGEAQATSKNCIEGLCITYQNNELSFKKGSDNVLKKIILSSDISRGLVKNKRFYIFTEGFIYSVKKDGSLENKLQIFFKPESIRIMGDSVLVVQDPTLQYYLVHQAGQMKLEKVLKPLNKHELFLSQSEQGEFVFFYPDKQILSNGDVKKIIILGIEPDGVLYINEQNRIRKKDRLYKDVPYTQIVLTNFYNITKFSKNFSQLNKQETIKLITAIKNPGLKDQILNIFIHHHLDTEQFNIPDLKYILETITDRIQFPLSNTSIVLKSIDLTELQRRRLFAEVSLGELYNELVVSYCQSIHSKDLQSNYDFLFQKLPSQESVKQRVAHCIAKSCIAASSILQLTPSDREYVAKKLVHENMFGSFLKSFVKRINIYDEEAFNFVEPYYQFLTSDEKKNIFAFLYQKSKDNLKKMVAKGDESRSIESKVKFVDLFVHTPEIRRLTALLDLDLKYVFDYSNNQDSSYVKIKLPIDRSLTLFSVKLDGNCTIKRTYEEKDSYTESIFIFIPVAEVDAVFNAKEYDCSINKESIVQLKKIRNILSEAGIVVKNAAQLETHWSFSSREIKEKLKITPNFIGESLLEEANASPQCKALRAQCMAKCAGYSDAGGGLLSSSPQESCESYCYDAFYQCNQAAKQ